jgi:signal transduction histidine kinase
MRVPSGSLKTRTALAMALLGVTILSVNAALLVLRARDELRSEVNRKAEIFAVLATPQICSAYETYYRSGFYRFREIMLDLLRRAPDAARIQVADVEGNVLSDSKRLDEAPQDEAGLSAERIEEPALLQALRGLEPTTLHASEKGFVIVAPNVESWGRHRFSVVYQFSYDSVTPQLQRQVRLTVVLTLLSILLAAGLGLALASRVTRPLAELTRGVREVAGGRFDQPLEVHAIDEIRALADSVNNMASRLQANLDDLAESNRRLAKANEELREVDRLKSDILANVSHELRTPLTTASGYVEYLGLGSLGALAPRQSEVIAVVRRNLERLARTVDLLLESSRLEVGRLRVEPTVFDLRELAASIGTGLSAALRQRKLQLDLHIPDDLPPVWADRDRIAQVLENLLVNALKFTPPGGHIGVVASAEAGSERVSVSVEDSGVGIPAQHVARIFERFYQADPSSTRRFAGVGLGLAIVKSILDAHGSQIDVVSEEGRGTRFSFTLPRAGAPVLEAPAPAV